MWGDEVADGHIDRVDTDGIAPRLDGIADLVGVRGSVACVRPEVDVRVDEDLEDLVRQNARYRELFAQGVSAVLQNRPGEDPFVDHVALLLGVPPQIVCLIGVIQDGDHP
jgi:hypothetical protein